MKIIIDNKIPFIKGRLEPFAKVTYANPGDFTPELVKDADALVVRTRTRCDASLLEGSAVKLIATATIGTDHIDTQWCSDNGITVRNAAGCNAPGVAQYVWSSLMNCGFDVTRHTLGIVGYGHIGSIVADWGRKMGVSILVCDPPRKERGLTDNDYIGLDELMTLSDAVTLHTPLTREGEYATRHLIAGHNFNLLKPHAILINAARGGVVDNEAWLRHLVAQPMAKAVIDVWEHEPGISIPLLQSAHIATPHIAGYSLEGKQRATRMALEAIEDTFGISVDKSGLEGEYHAPAAGVNAGVIAASYDPMADTTRLKQAPENFEQLRSDYNYRREPVFNS